MYTEDNMKKMASPAQEKEEEIDNEEKEDEHGSEEEEDNEDVGEGEEEEGGLPQDSDKSEENIPLPALPKEKKQSDVLNLNNEVVKMRKEVKRVRALIIRKLTRQIGSLKKKKGKEAEIERNQRRAARLLEEIHAMKVLLPDLVGFIMACSLHYNIIFSGHIQNKAKGYLLFVSIFKSVEMFGWIIDSLIVR